jgi:hypothetical protein
MKNWILMILAVLLSIPIEEGVYKWGHPSVGNVEMKRICKVPEHAKSFDRSHAL